ncbi:hypothetical protein PISMIDRAFT_675175 [Pisolithus microcarpus 441]|uniref:Uncharacterized protein n=1 Tax=Pisolithus microcarpus 441 TaxID=765257 RepID=A0A0C9ZDA4_9AGAM|nr:hypothetical protein PISMIDRAFT_675175 [Pisolithus microcarpus 441]
MTCLHVHVGAIEPCVKRLPQVNYCRATIPSSTMQLYKPTPVTFISCSSRLDQNDESKKPDLPPVPC